MLKWVPYTIMKKTWSSIFLGPLSIATVSRLLNTVSLMKSIVLFYAFHAQICTYMHTCMFTEAIG